MATVPLSGSNITFMSGVPFSNDYKHTRWFDNQTTQQNYFSARSVVEKMTQSSPVYFNHDGGRMFVSVSKSTDQLYGTNYCMFQNADYNNKWFYAFVTKLEYKQRNTTFVYLEIDVLQTWMFDLNFKPSFVVREHCKLWNSDGSPVVNTVPEDLNYGSEYTVADVQQYRPYNDLYFLVIVSKQGMHEGDPPPYIASFNGYPQNLCTYVHPFKMDGTSPDCNIALSQVGDVVNAMYMADTSVNNIVSMYITDVLPDFPTYSGNLLTFDTNNYRGAIIGGVNTVFVESLMSYGEYTYDNGNKYDGYTMPEESKLLMHPYTLLELVDFKGNKVTYKNEYIDGQLLNITVKGSLGINNKIIYQVNDYLTGNISDGVLQSQVAMESALIHDNPNDIPVLVDQLAAFIQGNRNSLQNQKNQIQFNAIMHTVEGVGSIAAGIATGSPMIAAAGFEQGVKGLGNDIFQMQGIAAKQKDIVNVPATMAKQGANANFDYGNGYHGLWIIKKEITDEYRTKLSDFFNAYGYKVNDIKIPNFHTRASWNYVQTKSCNITGNFNNEDLQELKEIFDHGITLWHTDDIGNYDLSNGVI